MESSAPVTVSNSSRYPFPRKARLLTSQDFQNVFRGTTCKSTDGKLAVLARPNGLPHARLGLAISKRVEKTAVGRNRIKRLVRASFRHNQQSLAGLDIVVLGRGGAPTSNNAALHTSLQTHWQRLAKRCERS
ncbi:MAG: ribonuclease P protein component [Gammaproteobacteria bacterium]|nr:ribonuclease P protein component [Gammaproteobacteria bacterium]